MASGTLNASNNNNNTAARVVVPMALLLIGLSMIFGTIIMQWGKNELASSGLIALIYGGGLLAFIGLAGFSGFIAEGKYQGVLGILPAALTLLIAVALSEALLRAYQVPLALIPKPSQVLEALWTARQVLLKDAYTTFVLEALVGYIIGAAAGFLTALAIARFIFLERGLMPYVTAFSSIPIVALAPILINALGLEWQSKAAVVSVTVFFPVLVNTVRGLNEINPLLTDLMRSYAAKPSQSFGLLRIPNALPFVFNGLKISTTLAMIGAIVGEFFGSTGAGLGFRIQISAGQASFDLVWAEIIVASVIGMSWYNLVATLERLTTAWHVSLRQPD
jgi:NitT/TauT family transport system permease protein